MGGKNRDQTNVAVDETGKYSEVRTTFVYTYLAFESLKFM